MRLRIGDRAALLWARRFNRHLQERDDWEERAEHAVRIWLRHRVADASSVADLGAGNERLRRILERECGAGLAYRAFDLHPQHRTTAKMDLRKAVPEASFDAVFCLGVLEYLPDVEAFLRRLHGVCRDAVISYVVADSPDCLSPAERRERGWLTDYTRAEFESLAEGAGFRRVAFASIDDDRTGLWVWRGE